MNYLLYIERAAENLQFFLWHKDYTRRFARLPEAQHELSPEWRNERIIHDSSRQPPSRKPQTRDDVPLVNPPGSPSAQYDIESCPSSSPNSPIDSTFDNKICPLTSSPTNGCCKADVSKQNAVWDPEERFRTKANFQSSTSRTFYSSASGIEAFIDRSLQALRNHSVKKSTGY